MNTTSLGNQQDHFFLANDVHCQIAAICRDVSDAEIHPSLLKAGFHLAGASFNQVKTNIWKAGAVIWQYMRENHASPRMPAENFPA